MLKLSPGRAQRLYRAHIDKVLNRKNTVTGIQYSEDPTILAWELANEPQVPLPYAWVDDTAAYIHNHSKQMVTTGFEGKQGEEWWKIVHKSPNIDFGSCHWVSFSLGCSELVLPAISYLTC